MRARISGSRAVTVVSSGKGRVLEEPSSYHRSAVGALYPSRPGLSGDLPLSTGHEVPNGLLLRSDLHRLFDKGYVGATPDHQFVVSKRLKDDFANGRSYYPLDGQRLHLPRSAADHPDRRQLEWHMDSRFRR